ncbi:hypothetical protein HBI71_068800 [Parastagonospora nodorum]|nr:hypothetical protein HBI71_068800 [Parastagonospora nodorum]
MSLCSHTFRAISRSRVSQSNTLLPFLYQTATILQWKPVTRPNTGRSVSSQPSPDYNIPFEDADGNLPPTFEEAQSARKTTITGSERAAFEKLYKTFNTQGRGRGKGSNGEHEELDQIADEYYEDDEESSGNSLDKVFDAVLQGSPRMRNAQRDGIDAKSKTKKSADTPVKTIDLSGVETPQDKRKFTARAEKERIRKLRLEERERIDTLLKSAPTDVHLWQTLDREVFAQLRKLDLDNPTTITTQVKKEPRSKNRQKPAPPTPANKIDVDTRIFFPNYPLHLLTAIKTLRTSFPRSPLPLAILPTIRSLGRSSYALGATTALYKALIRTAWVQQSSYALIDTLLTDMDANVVEFDLATLDLLDGIIRENELARAGKLGREMQMLYELEAWVEGFGKIVRWRSVVAERLGVREQSVARPERQAREVRQEMPLEDGAPDGLPDAVVARESDPFASEQTAESASASGEGEFDAVDVTAEGDADAEAEAEAEVEPPREENDAEDADKPAKIML